MAWESTSSASPALRQVLVPPPLSNNSRRCKGSFIAVKEHFI
jgi:hypothetical protein